MPTVWGVRSSRQIEALCEVDVVFRVITANRKSDCSTICRFRREFEQKLGDLFTAVLAWIATPAWFQQLG